MNNHLCFGDTIPKSGSIITKEWGEVYHAACYLAAGEGKSKITIVRLKNNCDEWTKSHDFLEKCAANKNCVEYSETKPNLKDIGYSADYFIEKNKVFKSAENALSSSIENLVQNKITSAIGISRATENNNSCEPTRCLFWIRHGGLHQPERDLTELAFNQINCVLSELNVEPILIGSSAPFAPATESKIIEADLINFWSKKFWKNQRIDLDYDPGAQLKLLCEYVQDNNIQFSIGMKSGGMDGLAFAVGLPTYYISKRNCSLDRMDKLESVFKAFRRVSVSYNKKFIEFSQIELEELYLQLNRDFGFIK